MSIHWGNFQSTMMFGSKSIIRGTRTSVALILEWVASGWSRDDILRSYPHLTAEDVEQALRYATAHLIMMSSSMP